MSYVNAEDVLPESLVAKIQEYIDGQIIYIPRKDENLLLWGEKSGARNKMAERNKRIRSLYYSGKTIAELSEMYYLSEKRIRGIVYEYELKKQEENSFGGRKMTEKLIIRKEEQRDFKQTECMTMRAFWNIHEPGCTEHLLVRMIRKSEDYLPEISRVAELDGKIVGAIYYTKARIVEDECTHDVITFGPLAVEPTCFGLGIGTALLKETIELARKEGYSGIALAGEPFYYPRLGFQRCDKYGISDANGNNYDALMCYPLNENFLSVHGRLIESPVYEACEKDQEKLAEISKEFPDYPKVKIGNGFVQIFEKHIGIIESVSTSKYQVRFWELSIPAYLNEEVNVQPKIGENVLFRWKPGQEAEITAVCSHSL